MASSTPQGVTHPVIVAQNGASTFQPDPSTPTKKVEKDQIERRFKLHASAIGTLVTGILLAIGITLSVLRNNVGGIKIPIEVTDKITSISTQLFITFVIYYIMHKSFATYMDNQHEKELQHQKQLKAQKEALEAASREGEMKEKPPTCQEPEANFENWKEPKVIVVDDWKRR
jgi:hypothetical protein